MNGKKLTIIGLALVCAFSLAGNLYLYQQKNSLTVQLAKQNKTIDELTKQAEDSNAKIALLQAQLDACTIDNIVVDTPEQAQAEQSTQGAADKTQQQAPTSDQAIQQEVQKEQEATTPSKPANPDKWQSSNPQVSNPSQDDVNDLLNDILGGGGSTSKPSAGSGDGYYGDGEIGSGTGGGGLGHGGEDTTNW